MNWSAKLTAISFLAVAALGTATFAGCKADSSTNGDTTGGDDDDTTGDDDDTTTTDGGGKTDSGGGGTCEGNKQEQKFEPAELQTCLDSNCCSELKTCFDIADTADGPVGCETYAQCMAQCNGEADAGDNTECFDACDASTSDAVKTAYTAILSCATTNKCVE